MAPSTRIQLLSFAAAGALLLGLGTTAALAVTDEFSKLCTMSLASGKDIQTDCSTNTEIQGKTYCFGSEEAMIQFMADPTGNLAKAQAYYSLIELRDDAIGVLGRTR
jgi:YHS domain-containing protein